MAKGNHGNITTVTRFPRAIPSVKEKNEDRSRLVCANFPRFSRVTLIGWYIAQVVKAISPHFFFYGRSAEDNVKSKSSDIKFIFFSKETVITIKSIFDNFTRKQ